MKTKVVATLVIVFILGIVSRANAQLKAGTPEESAYRKLMAENNPDTKLTLIADYQKTFPDSKVLADIYLAAMQVEFGEKVLTIDGENFTALITVSRTLSIEHKNPDHAIQCAEKAVTAVDKLRKQPAPPGQTDGQWKDYLKSLDDNARNILAYAKAMKP